MTERVSIIVCAYTESRWREQVAALASLHTQTRQPDEIIIVIDHNEALFNRSRAAFPDVIVIQNDQKRGLSGARNAGLRVATGDIIAFMDEDAQAEPTWLAALLTAYTDPAVMGVGGAILPAWEQGRPRWFPAEFDWVVGCTYKGLSEATAPVRNLIGCNMSLRRSVFDGVGGFRDGIGRVGTRPVGCEETELCIRARQHWPEHTFIYEPKARVHHVVPTTRANWRYFRSRCFSEGISKALVSQLVGAGDGLSSERSYTLKTLPLGVLAGLRDLLRGDGTGLGRAAAIVIGLVFTLSGFIVGKVAERRKATVKTQAPVVELSSNPQGLDI
jgi:GT2 family glycosyltransferase